MNAERIPFTSLYNKVKHTDGTARGTVNDTSFQRRHFHVLISEYLTADDKKILYLFVMSRFQLDLSVGQFQ